MSSPPSRTVNRSGDAHPSQHRTDGPRVVPSLAERWSHHPGGTHLKVVPCHWRATVSRATVAKWRTRFVEARLDGLHDEPRPGGPRSISDADVERVIVKTLEETPKGATHWSTRSMATATGMSQSAVSRIWLAFALKPHLVDEFKLSPDPQFIDKVRDIVGLYLNPPEAAAVLCVDEKT
jgi:hypothetical protein